MYARVYVCKSVCKNVHIYMYIHTYIGFCVFLRPFHFLSAMYGACRQLQRRCVFVCVCEWVGRSVLVGACACVTGGCVCVCVCVRFMCQNTVIRHVGVGVGVGVGVCVLWSVGQLVCVCARVCVCFQTQ